MSVIYNYNQPKRHNIFLKSRHDWKAYPTKLPCVCKRGNEKNVVHGDKEWLTPTQRTLAQARSIRFSSAEPDVCEAYEYYYQDEYCNFINELCKGGTYHIRRIEDFPKVPQLIENLKEAMTAWEK